MFVFIKVKPSHIEKSGKDKHENFSDPQSHLVRFWCSEMNVKDKNSNTNTERRSIIHM